MTTQQPTLPGAQAVEVKPAEPEKLLLFGFDLHKLSESSRFMVLAVGALVCALLFAALQEKVFHVEGFKYYGYMTTLTTATYMGCAALERFMLGETVRKGSLRDYALLSIFTFLGMFLTNWSLAYLTYPTRVMFKSSKVIPVMVFSVIIVGRKYQLGEYLAALLLVVGITLFTLADKGLPSFNIIGIFLISLGVLSDAVTCNFEERRFFRNLSCSQAEVVLFSSVFGLAISLVVNVVNGELGPAIAHSVEHPEVYVLTAIFSAMGYCSVVFVLLLIKGFGSTNAEIVKSCRKVMSIILSFVLYHKPINSWHVYGFLVFVASILITVKLKANKKKQAAPAASVEDGDASEKRQLTAAV